ncbi:MAG: hypothetical protein HUU38_08290 [Anaerolineales bacterium]|nr:hypothetical protein [Anaerolineales bacterium]
MRKIHLAGFLILCLATLPALAQRANLIADIPFSFYAGDELMSAGRYTVTQPHLTSTLVRGVESKKAAILGNFFTKLREPTTSGGYLLFHQYPDGRRFLAEAWMPFLDTGAQMVPSRKEKESVSSRVVTQARPTRLIVLATVR